MSEKPQTITKDFNTSSERLEQMIEPGQTIAKLMNDSEDLGYVNKDLKEFAKLLQRAWFMQHLSELKTLSKTPPIPLLRIAADGDVSIFPSEDVTNHGSEIKVHGVFHGRGSYEGGNLQYRDQLRSYVEYTLRKGERWYIEEGLKEDFALPEGCVSLHDISSYKTREEENIQKLPWLKRFFYNLSDQRFNALMRDSDYMKMTDTIRTNSELTLLCQDIKKGFITNQDYFLPLYNFVRLAKLPEPLDMEVKIALIVPLAEIPTHRNLGITRSHIQAQEVYELEIVREHDGRLAHVLVGQEHGSQVTYFLKSPNYDPVISLSRAISII